MPVKFQTLAISTKPVMPPTDMPQSRFPNSNIYKFLLSFPDYVQGQKGEKKIETKEAH